MKPHRITFAALMLGLVAATVASTVAVAAPPPLGITLPVKVVKVYDSDTATEVEITIRCQVRYDQCWGLELSEPGGKEAAALAKQAEGKSGRLHIPLKGASNVADLFTFGRVLGTIYLDGEKYSESQKQIRAGYASSTKKGVLGE